MSIGRNSKALILNAAGLVLLTAWVPFSRYCLSEIEDTFVSRRKAEVTFFHKLVKDNWDGITSITEEQKKVLLNNLDSSLAGYDVHAMTVIAFSIICVVAFALALQCVVNIIKAFRIPSNERMAA
jgi:hypothetical protein